MTKSLFLILSLTESSAPCYTETEKHNTKVHRWKLKWDNNENKQCLPLKPENRIVVKFLEKKGPENNNKRTV